jgi:hypothetical protein
VRRFVIAALSVLLVVLVPVVASATSTPEPRCAANKLAATFAHVPGSDATGQELYRLAIRTRGASCALPGDITLQLLSADGAAVPTRVSGRITAKRVTPSGTKIYLELSPDLYGPGEPASGPCERVAHQLRVRTAVGTLVAPVTPPTPVCHHGAMTVISAREVQ